MFSVLADISPDQPTNQPAAAIAMDADSSNGSTGGGEEEMDIVEVDSGVESSGGDKDAESDAPVDSDSDAGAVSQIVQQMGARAIDALWSVTLPSVTQRTSVFLSVKRNCVFPRKETALR